MGDTKSGARIFHSGLTGRYYVATRWTEHDGGMVEVRGQKYDVTEQVEEIAAGVVADRDRYRAALLDMLPILDEHAADVPGEGCRTCTLRLTVREALGIHT